ncbi:hypothetical protein HRbin36_02549 [bacterium HR36]|nr:hypothetical protein HRbin36_02549 [bacterium HR36]
MRVAFQALQADAFQVAVNARIELARRHRTLRPYLPHGRHPRWAFERWSASEHLVQNGAQAVNVGGQRDHTLLARGLLGSHVTGRPDDFSDLCQLQFPGFRPRPLAVGGRVFGIYRAHFSRLACRRRTCP